LDHIKSLLRQAEGAGFAHNAAPNHGHIVLARFAGSVCGPS
jgi:hypothetical protein